MPTTIIRMTEDAARETLLVRAIEAEDREGLLLTIDDRRHASDAALASSGSRPDTFLPRRAQLALQRLTGRFPALSKVVGATRWPLWLSLGIPLLGLVLGLSTNAFAGDRINILAFPLLGLIAWNLVAYLVLAGNALRRAGRERAAAGRVAGTLARLVNRTVSASASQPTLERALLRFGRDWSVAAGRLTEARVRLALHLAAALFAFGMVAAMLVRARYMVEYEAGWAGTFTGAEKEVAALLAVVLGPASWLTGIALPGPAELAELRRTEENAGNWLLLWAVTAGLLVILPRMVLALLNALQIGVLKRRVPVEQDFVLRTVLRDATGEPGRARVVPYALEPGAEERERLQELLGSTLGRKVRLTIDPPVRYGEEEAWLEREGDGLVEADRLLLLFSLASTPEAENHGAFAAAVRQRLGKGPTELLVLLDEGAFRRRLGTSPSAERRLAERRQSWRSVLAGAGVEPLPLSLDGGAGEEEARTLERAMLEARQR